MCQVLLSTSCLCLFPACYLCTPVFHLSLALVYLSLSFSLLITGSSVSLVFLCLLLGPVFSRSVLSVFWFFFRLVFLFISLSLFFFFFLWTFLCLLFVVCIGFWFVGYQPIIKAYFLMFNLPASASASGLFYDEL